VLSRGWLIIPGSRISIVDSVLFSDAEKLHTAISPNAGECHGGLFVEPAVITLRDLNGF
jgi:hypothetical protein